jgi:hypothetical protein
MSAGFGYLRKHYSIGKSYIRLYKEAAYPLHFGIQRQEQICKTSQDIYQSSFAKFNLLLQYQQCLPF